MKRAYQKLLDNKQLSYDPAQVNAVDALSYLSTQLSSVFATPLQNKTRKNFFDIFSASKASNNLALKGIYFHGKVGRGKTMLMDLFYHNLKIKNKKRIHFHHFMEDVHQQLITLKGVSEPLTHIAKAWAKKVDLLCFDEFFVSDIGDAMLLSGIFEALFQQGITLVATSNCQPEQLYRNGLQRERFLPTIDLIYQHCQVISVDGEIDHRTTSQNFITNEGYTNYFLLANKGNEQLTARYKQCTLSEELNVGVININHRDINYLALNEQCICFDFFSLCSGPRSQRDYMAIATQFSTVFIRNVPQFTGELVSAVFSGVEDSYQRSGVLMGSLRHLDDEARRFIALVDEFYDRKVQLVISAEVDIEHLYQGQQLAFEFARCRSRLIEMQNSKSELNIS